MSRPTPSPRPAAREQRGSVLIFVVGVLLLLAIIATAFLGTSRSDRAATQQNNYNTQIDLLLDGVVNSIKASVLSDARYNTGVDKTDSLAGDTFLASRMPVLGNQTTDLSQAGAAGPAQLFWPYVSGPLLDTAFSYPMEPASIGNPPSLLYARRQLIPTSMSYKGQQIPAFGYSTAEQAGMPWLPYTLAPVAFPAIDADGDGIADSGMVRLPVGPISGVTYFYGARIVDLNSAVNANTAYQWNDTPAAGTLPGNFFPSNVDLFYALSGAALADRQAQMNDPVVSLNAYRLGQPTDTPLSTTLKAFDDDDKTAPNPGGRPDYQFSSGSEILWSQLGRRLDNPGYIERTSSPSDIRQTASLDINNSLNLFQKFIIKGTNADNNPSALEYALKLSLLGQASGTPIVTVNTKAYNVNDTANWFNQNFAFPRGNPLSQTMPLRSLLTAFNPTAADTIKPEATQITTLPKYFYFGDIVTQSGRNFVCIAPFIDTTVAGYDVPGTTNGQRSWALLGWVGQPQKTDLNTADFGEMYWSFRRLMSAEGTTAEYASAQFAANSPFPIRTGTNNLPAAYSNSPYELNKWRQYRNVIRDPLAQDPIVTYNPKLNLPGSNGRFMHSSEVMQMRAALAAVNAIDLRDNDDNITARRITTAIYNDALTPKAVERHAVTVFGTERQPYITEVYVNNDTSARLGSAGTGAPSKNPRGYVAIELYNPYAEPLNLNGWTVGVINRRRGTANPPAVVGGKAPGQPIQIDPILPTTPLAAARFNASVVVPAKGYLILENFKDPVNSGDPTVPDPAVDAVHRPSGAVVTVTTLPVPCSVKFVSGLSRVLNDGGATVSPQANGGELVLLRPRLDNLTTGVFTSAVQPNDPVDPCEEVDLATDQTHLYDLVPIDSFDFTNMNAVTGNTNFNVWHYIRENSATGPNAWKWAKAKPYVVSGAPAGTPQTLVRQGEIVGAVGGVGGTFTASPSDEPAAVPAVQLGVADPTGTTPVDPYQGVQINADGWPSPRPKNGVFNLYPGGVFVRETDAFMIPTIGAYKILTLGATAVATPDGMNLPAQTAADIVTIPADSGNFTEMNALPMDESFADDQDAAPGTSPTVPGAGAIMPYVAGPDEAYEQVGRLCPTHTIKPEDYLEYPYTIAFPTSGATAPDFTKGELYSASPTAAQLPMDWYDPNFDYANGVAVKTGFRSILDYFTTRSRNNALPNVGPDEYTAWMTTPAAMPTASSPISAIKPPNISYTVGGASSTSSTLVRGANLPQQAAGATVNYTGCAVQLLSGPNAGAMSTITAGGNDSMTISPALPSTTLNQAVRILSTTPDVTVDHGLININTAPWYVLARLPMVLTQPAGTGTVNADANSDMAKMIVLFRDGDPNGATLMERRGHGPFKSILDLNRVIRSVGGTNVPFFQGAYAYSTTDATAAGAATPTITVNGSTTATTEGDITPGFLIIPPATTPTAVPPESVPGDFENRYLALGRIANMITTKSDAFMVYVNLQGWRDAGTPNATLVTQRRAALLIDRSSASATVPDLSTTKVPTN